MATKVKVKVLLTLPDIHKKAEIDKIIENLECIFSSGDTIIESQIFDTEKLKQ
jgi:hypothetical protein